MRELDQIELSWIKGGSAAPKLPHFPLPRPWPPHRGGPITAPTRS